MAGVPSRRFKSRREGEPAVRGAKKHVRGFSAWATGEDEKRQQGVLSTGEITMAYSWDNRVNFIVKFLYGQ